MEQIIIRVKDKEKAMTLRKMLNTLDYVESVSEEAETDTPSSSSDDADRDAFFAAAGIWQGRDVTLDSLRQKAWPRQSEPK